MTTTFVGTLLGSLRVRMAGETPLQATKTSDKKGEASNSIRHTHRRITLSFELPTTSWKWAETVTLSSLTLFLLIPVARTQIHFLQFIYYLFTAKLQKKYTYFHDILLLFIIKYSKLVLVTVTKRSVAYYYTLHTGSRADGTTRRHTQPPNTHCTVTFHAYNVWKPFYAIIISYN